MLYRLQIFMQGRYGVDELYRFLFVVYAVLLVVNAFVHSAGIYIALWVLLIYGLFRILSKNISARQKENAKYLIIKSKLKKKLEQLKTRAKDKEHVYKTCPHCRATLRLPRRKGKHTVNCPRCHKEFGVRVFKGN